MTWPTRLRSPTIASGSSGAANSSVWLEDCAEKSSTSCCEQLAELERLEREREAPGLDLLHVEEVVDEGGQPLRLAVDRLQVAAAGVVVEVVVHEQLGEAEHAGEGVRSSCETVATSSDLSRAASRSAVISRTTMMRPISSPAESCTGPVWRWKARRTSASSKSSDVAQSGSAAIVSIVAM